MSLPRYPKYKNSGVTMLGDVPEGWTVEPFRRFVDVAEGQVDPEDETYSTMGLIAPNHVEAGTGRLIRLEGASEQGAESGKYLCRKGDVVYSKIRPSLRKVCLAPEECLCSADMYPLRPRSGMHGIFLLWTVLSEQFSAWAIADSQRVAMPKINRESLKSIPIAIPPLAHQIKIAAFLDRETAKIDGLVGEQRRLIELLCEERRVIILKCVTRGLEDRVSLKPFGMAGCGDVPINWAVGRVKSICTFITSGPRGWSERVGDEGALFIQSGDLDDALQVQFTGAKRVQVEDDAESARTRVSEGDVLICVTGAKTGNVGVCTAIPEPAYVNQHLCLIRPGRRMLPAFLGNLLKCDFGQRQLALAQYGLKQGLSLEDVACIPVLIPPLVEQTAIVDHLRITTARLDELVAAADQAITVLQERRTALISAAVTGKIDVRGLA